MAAPELTDALLSSPLALAIAEIPGAARDSLLLCCVVAGGRFPVLGIEVHDSAVKGECTKTARSFDYLSPIVVRAECCTVQSSDQVIFE